MSGIIKHGNLSGLTGVRTVAEHPPAAPVVPIGKYDEERDSLLRRIAKLEEELRRRDTEAENLRALAKLAGEDGVEQGYESGLVAAQDRQTERLALLEKSMTKAQTSLAESLSSLSRLSALLAQDCVDIVLGSANDRADFISRIIESQIKKIDRSMVVDIRVSRLDFPNDSEIAKLIERAGLLSIVVTAGEEMPSGSCVMTLRLGRISVGIDQQWPVLRRLLDDMALPETAG